MLLHSLLFSVGNIIGRLDGLNANASDDDVDDDCNIVADDDFASCHRRFGEES